MEKYQTIWGKRIKELLDEKGLTQKTLAEAIAIYNNETPRPTTISDWMNKGSKPNQKNIEALAFILDVTPGYIMGDASKEESDIIVNARKAMKEKLFKRL